MKGPTIGSIAKMRALCFESAPIGVYRWIVLPVLIGGRFWIDDDSRAELKAVRDQVEVFLPQITPITQMDEWAVAFLKRWNPCNLR